MKLSSLIRNDALGRNSRRTVAECNADSRRLEFLRFLSTQNPPISADEILWLNDLLERARLAEYHYEFKHAERTIADDLFFQYGAAYRNSQKQPNETNQ